MFKRYFGLLALIALVALAGLAAPEARADEVPRMEAKMLLEKLEMPDVVVVDVRRNGDWNKSDSKIKNAIRRSSSEVEKWAPNLDKGKTIILYCA